MGRIRIIVWALMLAALAGGCASDAPPSEEQAARQAPDFTLALADGYEFVLSAEQRATFLIFWAEW